MVWDLTTWSTGVVRKFSQIKHAIMSFDRSHNASIARDRTQEFQGLVSQKKQRPSSPASSRQRTLFSTKAKETLCCLQRVSNGISILNKTKKVVLFSDDEDLNGLSSIEYDLKEAKTSLQELKNLSQGLDLFSRNKHVETHNSLVLSVLHKEFHALTHHFNASLQDRLQLLKEKEEKKKLYMSPRDVLENESQHDTSLVLPVQMSATQKNSSSRLTDIKRIQESLEQIKIMFDTLTFHLSDQQHTLNIIEGDIEASQDYLSEAEKELRRFKQRQSSTRKTILTALGVVAGFALVLFII